MINIFIIQKDELCIGEYLDFYLIFFLNLKKKIY